MKFKNFWIQYKIDGVAHDRKVPDDVCVIGRAPDCNLTIDAEVLSRYHLKFSIIEEKVYVEDLGSTNGTYIDKAKLEPNKKVEYTSGKPLYIYGEQSVGIRVTPLFDKTQEELEIEAKEFELARQKEILDRKNQRIKKDLQKEKYIRAAGESVDSIYENLKYVAKSARFSKEKAIAAAEGEAERILLEAEDAAQKAHERAAEEIKEIEAKTKKEVKKIIAQAKEKAHNKVQRAQEKAELLETKAYEQLKKAEVKAEKILKNAQSEAEEQKTKIMASAQEKHGEIIAEAYLKNKELKEENLKLITDIKDANSEKLQLEADLADMKSSIEHNKKEANQAKDEAREQISYLNSLKLKVLDLENKNNEAKRVLESEIPGLEEKINHLKSEAARIHEETEKEKEELSLCQTEIKTKTDDLEKLESKSDKAEIRLDELSTKIIEAEDNLFKLNKIRQQRNEDVDKEIALKRQEQKQKETEALRKIEKKHKRAQKEIEVNIEKAKERALSIINEAKEEKANIDKLVADRKKQVEDEVMAQLASTRQETEDLRKQTKLETDELIQKTNNEIEALRKKLKEENELEREKLISEAKTEAENMVAKAKKEADKIMSAVQEQADYKQNSLQEDIEKRKKETDKEIHDLRAKTVSQLEEQKKQFEAEEEQKNRLRALKLNKELNNVLRVRIAPFLKEKDQIEKVASLLGKSVNAVMLDEIDEELLDTEVYSDIDPSLQQAKNKKFFIASGIGAGLLILFLFLIPTFKEAAVESSRNLAAEMEEETKKQIEKVKKEGDLSKAFTPEKKDKYLGSYTDRVLYTKRYVEIELNNQFREQWIIELQDFFVDELRLSENNLVPFIAQEANLIRELDSEMKKINGNFVDQGVARMREIEKSFIKRLRQHVRKKSDFKKIMKFKKKFYDENKVRF